VVEEQGPPHDRVFAVSATIDGVEIARGAGRSKKDAEQEAAQAALAALQQ
jgi:ribonuclease-3